MRSPIDIFGGTWVFMKLFIQCKGRMGSGSYLRWRRETAFGKKSQFPSMTLAKRWRAMLDWAIWAWKIERKRYK